jgi:hypothetical protein
VEVRLLLVQNCTILPACTVRRTAVTFDWEQQNKVTIQSLRYRIYTYLNYLQAGTTCFLCRWHLLGEVHVCACMHGISSSKTHRSPYFSTMMLH